MATPTPENNLAALRALTAARATGKATDEQIAAMTLWRGWGALPKVFERSRTDDPIVQELRALLGDNWGTARRTVLNAHYTDPALVELLWGAATRAGIRGGYVLEIGCGRGDVFDGAPPGRWTFHGIELDPTTAEICQWTHPDADIVNGAIERTDITHGGYDLVIGNVPFASVAPAAVDNPDRLSLHDYCITRALDAVRPGGIVALITSRYSLDKVATTARENWAASADLLAAWRLPADAHKEYAGTQVVTDVLVFRRRQPGDTPNSIDFVSTAPVSVFTAGRYGDPTPINTGNTVTMNKAFSGDTPAGFMMGYIQMGGMYSADDFTIERPGWQAITRNGHTLRNAREIHDMAVAEIPSVASPRTAADPLPSMTPRRERHRTAVSGDTPAGMSEEGVALYEIGVIATAVLSAERDNDFDRASTLRTHLATEYASYVQTYGRIRRTRRGPAKAAWAELLDHNVWPIVGSLEHRDSDTGEITEAALLTRPVISSPAPVNSAATPVEAVGVSIAETGRIDVDRIAELLNLPVPDAVTACAGIIFYDPESSQWEPAPVYLSGNIRQKLVVAEIAAAQNDQFAANIAALEAVAPPWVSIADIHLTMANPILTPSTLSKFLTSIGWSATIDHVAGKWTITNGVRQYNGHGWQDFNPEHCGIMVVLRNALNGTKATIKYEDGRVNIEGTLAANDAIERINERFSLWVIGDPELTAHFEREHNTRFNAHRTADFTGIYPDRVIGMAADFALRDYQSAAVARAVLTPGASLVGHPVGAGKTAVAAATVMEWIRVGRANRCMVVVPNTLLEDFVIEWQRIFPLATILVGGVETSKRTRGQLFADIASGAYPVTIVPRSMFERLPSSPDAVQAWIDEETASLYASLESAQQNNSASKTTVKRIEKAIAALEARLTRAAAVDNKDGIVPFDLLGIDALVVDEIHGWKRLPITSSLPSMSDTGSQRAVDLAVKLHTMRATARRGGPAVLGLTGTYVTNRIGEIWTMMRYLAPEILEAAGTSQFDDWAAVHAETVTTMEMNPTGSGWRETTRIAKYKNMPELMGQVTSFASLMSQEELDIERPQRSTVVITSEATHDLREFVATLVERAEACTGRRTKEELSEDNMLKVVNDGRLAALDMRLVGFDDGGNKLRDAADKIAEVHRATADNVYMNRDGSESPNRGALQIVFCSLGIHTEFSAWNELRRLLVDRGVPDAAIRDSNEMTSSTKRAKLLADCRNGKVAVLIGSFERVGLGVNIQDRVIAIHEINPEWRPDIHIQGEGRGDRFGNQNPAFTVYRYVTGGSFDVYMWSTLERKMKFVAQVASGNVLSRDLPELDATIYSFAQAKAAATGDPRHLELIDAENELSKLHRLSGIYDAETRRRHINADRFDYQATLYHERADLFERVIAETPATGPKLRANGEPLTYRQIANRLEGGEIREITAGGTPFKVVRRWGDAPFEISHDFRTLFRGSANRIMNDFNDFAVDPAGYVAQLRRQAERMTGSGAAERNQPPFQHADRIVGLADFVSKLRDELTAADPAA